MAPTEYCMTFGTLDHEGHALEERLHVHVDAPDEETAIARALQCAIADNVSVRGCVLVITRVIELDPQTVDYAEKARLMNHGHDAPLPPSTSKHLH